MSDNPRSSMIVSVKFLAGTTIGDAIEEAKAKAAMWDVAYVCFDFNGTHISIGRNANAYDVTEEFKSSSHGNSIIAA